MCLFISTHKLGKVYSLKLKYLALAYSLSRTELRRVRPRGGACSFSCTRSPGAHGHKAQGPWVVVVSAITDRVFPWWFSEIPP